MSRKSLTATLIILLLCTLLAACGGNSDDPSASPTPSPSPSDVAPSAGTPPTSGSAAPGEEIARADAPTDVTQVLDWFAQPTHGGFFAAHKQQFYQDANLNVTLQNGGPQVSAVQIVASGKADFGLAGADALLLAREQGIPVVALGAVLQISPSALFYHKENTSIRDFGDLNGHKVYAVLAATYWQYLKSAYKLDDVQEFQFNGQYANFVEDKTAVTQGYVTNTLADLESQGVETNHLLVADSGYRPYYTVIFTTEKYIEEHPDVVKAYVQATVKGWNYYKDHAPEISGELVKVNANGDAAGFDREAEAQKEFVFGHDAAERGVGYMSKERWEELSRQLHDIGALTKNEDVTKAFTTAFLPQG